MDTELDIVSELPTTLRRKRGPIKKTEQTCSKCEKIYPRTEEFFYKKTHQPHHPHFHIAYLTTCIRCDNERTQEWKRVNAKKKNQQQLKYTQTENGFFREMYNNVVKSRHGNEFKNLKEFKEHWEDQKKVYGWKCPVLGIEMTMIRGQGRGKTTGTNVSKDRLVNSRPYSKQNVMFVSWQANNEKGDITPKVAKKFLHFVKERYGTDEVE